MPIIEYTPDLFEALQEMVVQVPRNMNLGHRPFVDYYYATRNTCKLYLFFSDSGKVLGTIGSELLRFELNSQEITIRIGSNWFSLHRGIGGQLSSHSAMRNPNAYGMVFIASHRALNVLRHTSWFPVAGLKGYFLNACSLRPWNSWWKSAANLVVRQFAGRRIGALAARIPDEIASTVQVEEEFAYTPDMLPRSSRFSFRFAPTAEYLAWRYNLSLAFVRYRLFRVLAAGRSVGYVILNDSPEQTIVAQCDAEDAMMLSYGVLLAILEAGKNYQATRGVFLSSCHPEMSAVFEAFGFRRWMRPDLPFGFRNVPPGLNLRATSNWLINYDWSDNGLQAPFLDQTDHP